MGQVKPRKDIFSLAVVGIFVICYIISRVIRIERTAAFE